MDGIKNTTNDDSNSMEKLEVWGEKKENEENKVESDFITPSTRIIGLVFWFF